MEIILKYFPELSREQIDRFAQLKDLYILWNEKINVISRKDIDQLYERHVLHSLGIAKVMEFKENTRILDIGTGGGFPGIPLAILFPKAHFHLVDSIGKKIKVVEEVAKALRLENIKAEHARAETLKGTYHFVISRAVTRLQPFCKWVHNKFSDEHFNQLNNGILYLKGGDLTDELSEIDYRYTIYNLSTFFKEDFFETKKVVYLRFS